MGRYAWIHAGGRQYLAQHSLTELERMLDGAQSVRVHRSAIVNEDTSRLEAGWRPKVAWC